MAKIMAKTFIDESNFGGLQNATNNNLVVIGNLEFSIPSDETANNKVYCSFRGEYLEQVTLEEIRSSSKTNIYSYGTSGGTNYILLAIPKEISNVSDATKYIRGMLVEYQIADLAPVGSCKEPLYEVSTYLLNGTLVSTTVACSMVDIVRKIQALEANLDINESGYYKHIVRLALVQK